MLSQAFMDVGDFGLMLFSDMGDSGIKKR